MAKSIMKSNIFGQYRTRDLDSSVYAELAGAALA